MGIPAGKMLIKYGYKKTALIALAVGLIGLALQYLSSIAGDATYVFTYQEIPVALNLIIYLLGAFICGFSVCMLNTVVNPMLNLLGGGGNKGNQLIQVGGTLNSLTATLTPSLTGILVGTVTADTSMSNVAPLLFIGMAVFAISFIIISRVSIPEPTLGKEQPQYEHSPLAFRHTLLGVIAIFFYVGIEIGIPMHLQFYVTELGFEGSAAIGGVIAGIYWILMMVGRATSSVISGKVSTSLQMIVVTSIAIALLLIAIFMPESNTVVYDGHDIPVKAFFIAACGICTSIMWGAIFNLAVEGLGKYTEQASGIFMMMVVGGGVIPLVQDALSKSVGYINSYWLIFILVGYMCFYALFGSKNVNKNIPVE
jgi:FHS family L-fucose permease-like MFS transporter